MTMTRITKDPKERRQEIIDTAMKVFYEKGYEKTAIADIAREMHVAQGLCYRYFSSKEELFDTALDQYAQRQDKQHISPVEHPNVVDKAIDHIAWIDEIDHQIGNSLSCALFHDAELRRQKSQSDHDQHPADDRHQF